MKKVYEYLWDMPSAVRKKYFGTPEKCIETLRSEYLNNREASAFPIPIRQGSSFLGTCILIQHTQFALHITATIQ